MYSWKLGGKKYGFSRRDLSLALILEKYFLLALSVGLDLPWIMTQIGFRFGNNFFQK